MSKHMEPKTYSDRIRVLLENFYDDYCAERDLDERGRIYREVFSKNAEKSEARKTALGLETFLKNKKILLREYDLLAGNVEYYDYTDTLPIDKRQVDPYLGGAEGLMLFGIEKEIERYAEIKGKETDPKNLEVLDRFQRARDSRVITRWGSAHAIAGYEKLIVNGFQANIDEGEAFLEHETDPEKRECIENMLITDRAAQAYILRYEQKAREQAKATGNAGYKKTLMRIANACRNLSEKPAKSFFEAVQMMILVHDVIMCESLSGSLSLGRVDQILYPYYKKDMEAGNITPEEAQELINALWLKFGRMISGYQNVTLGGRDRYGGFAGNDITLFCLRASYNIRMEQPLMSFRYHKDMPAVFWKDIVNLIRTGTGFPAMFNDEAIIKAKMDAGVQLSDVWNFGIIGCVEPSIGGDEYSKTEEMRVSWAKIMEMIMFGGVCGITGVKVDMAEQRQLDGIKDFEEFYGWFKKELLHFTDLAIEGTNLLDETYGDTWPVPFLSSTYNSTFRKAKDVTKGGAKYNFSSINSVGMADAVDSLLVIKKLVFENREISLTELAEVLRKDFEGHEILWNRINQLKGRFGNDTDEANQMMKELSSLFVDRIRSAKNNCGENFQAGMYSVYYHATMGEFTSALPCGRRAKASLTNGFAPCQGADVSGPTAVVNSILSADHSKLGNGMVLDIKFTPKFLESEAHQQGFIDLIRDYFDRGGMEMQINVVNRDTLIEAQKHPEKHRNLIVRVSGYSAYFIYLGKSLQDEIIARTEIG